MYMAEKKIISWDCDDILVDTTAVLISWHNHTYGSKLCLDDMQTFHLSETWSCSEEEATRRFREFWLSDQVHDIKPYAQAQHAVAQLPEYLHVSITSRNPDLRLFTQKSLDDHFSQCFSGLYFSQHVNTLYTSGKSKAEICKEIGSSVHIDDCHEYAVQCAQAGTPTLLLDMPWNRRDTPAGVIRLYSALEIPEKIKYLLG
jgi:uncharacterized HAD superfamily protein